jgi:hypothetical protein
VDHSLRKPAIKRHRHEPTESIHLYKLLFYDFSLKLHLHRAYSHPRYAELCRGFTLEMYVQNNFSRDGYMPCSPQSDDLVKLNTYENYKLQYV